MLVAQMMRYGSDSAQRGYANDSMWRNYPMMWGWGNGSGFWFGSIFCIITWLAFVAVLIALARWLWLKGNQEKKGR